MRDDPYREIGLDQPAYRRQALTPLTYYEMFLMLFAIAAIRHTLSTLEPR